MGWRGKKPKHGNKLYNFSRGKLQNIAQTGVCTPGLDSCFDWPQGAQSEVHGTTSCHAMCLVAELRHYSYIYGQDDEHTSLLMTDQSSLGRSFALTLERKGVRLPNKGDNACCLRKMG